MKVAWFRAKLLIQLGLVLALVWVLFGCGHIGRCGSCPEVGHGPCPFSAEKCCHEHN